MTRTTKTCLACILALFATGAFAEPPLGEYEADQIRTGEATSAQPGGASDAVPITDPWLLESWGFESDAPNVYASPRVQAELARIAMGSAEAEAAQRSESAALAASEAEAASPFGSTLGHTVIDQAAFLPLRSTTAHEFDPAGGRFCVDGFPWFEGVFEGLPHGARLTRFQFWTFDSSSDENIPGFVKRTCNQDLGGPLLTILATYASFGSGGFQTAIDLVDADDDDIDTRCTYSAVFRLDGQDSAVCSEDDNLRIVGAGARWIRQVSPPPDTAIFDDVPTSHPFFQHIEALVASGITAGCDADSFCPGDPLTRGQMAVFLAKALGLNWN